MNRHQAQIRELVANAIGDETGFIQVMAHKNVDVRRDVPYAFEVYSLLHHYLDSLNMEMMQDGDVANLRHSIQFDEQRQRLMLMINVGANELEYVAHWIADRLPSNQVKSMAGILVVPFIIETLDDIKHLIPEWCAAFYVSGNADHCVPILVMQSILGNSQFGGDWVESALNRLEVFGLLVGKAKSSTRMKTQ